ncbi:PilW family protein [Alkalibacterium sp. f15]|uniref:PilW family protein n=1 Tax=Alkalibacterium sp. f15 TaxID=3414029 RepID=UPI003BF7B28E
MRKWKRDCLLPQKVNNKMNWKKEEGITLVELLAAIAILSVVIILVGSVHIFGQRQFINQTESASQANDLTYSLSVISRDMRKQNATSVTSENGNILIDNVILFSHNNTELRKNTEVLSNKVRDAQFDMIYEKDEKIGLTVTLFSTGNQQNQFNQYQTTIYFRR